MKTYVALLRAINVGGNNKVPMEQLRALFGKLGGAGVETYVNSGNVVFRHAATDESKLATELEAAIAKKFKCTVPVVLRTDEELAAVPAENPFPKLVGEPKRLHVMFLSDVPKKPALASLDPKRSPGDSYLVLGREIFMSVVSAAETRLTVDYFEKRLGGKATARNWKTVNKLIDMARKVATSG
ncbi:MAG: DUF1697 domain-containing protein [Deltaproteobacteria bacterium]|nr:DUF1697 domain-containing protein [Deltaproteobacteria bacterium]